MGSKGTGANSLEQRGREKEGSFGWNKERERGHIFATADAKMNLLPSTSLFPDRFVVVLNTLFFCSEISAI